MSEPAPSPTGGAPAVAVPALAGGGTAAPSSTGTASAGQVATPKDVLGGAQNKDIPDWRRDHLPEAMRTEASLQPFKDIEGLAKSYVEAQKMIGQKGLTLPKADAPKEAWDPVWKALGRPDAADAYEVTVPDGLPVSPDELKHWKEQAHALGLSKGQAEGLINGYLKRETDRAATANAEHEIAIRKEWGSEFDKNAAIAAKAALWAGPEFLETLQQAGLGSNQTVLKALYKLGQTLMDDSTSARSQLAGFGTNKEQATQELTTLMGNKDWLAAITDRSNPGHAAAQAQKAKLDRILAS